MEVASRKLDYVIPRRISEDSVNSLLIEVTTDSDKFRNFYAPLIYSKLSNNSSYDRNNLKISSCRSIQNRRLEANFNKCQMKLAKNDDPSDISYGYFLLPNNSRELELYAEYGLSADSNFVGDLGNSKNGVYLNDCPDLTTPASFPDETPFHILACKVLKGRTKVLPLGSFHVEPSYGYNSHIAIPPRDSKLTRHESYRYSQIYLFEQEDENFARVPSNVLPFAAFELLHTKKNAAYRPNLSVLWEGSLKVGNYVVKEVNLSSTTACCKPSFLDSVFEICEMIPWDRLLCYAPILELLKVPIVGDLPVKKEIPLFGSLQFANYYILQEKSETETALSRLHESMRIRRAAGLTILPSDGILMLIPNGQLSSLLALPTRATDFFHCIYLSSSSLNLGNFELPTSAEDNEFYRQPFLEERVDGASEQLQNFARRLASTIHSNDTNICEIWKQACFIDDEVSKIDSSPLDEKGETLTEDESSQRSHASIGDSKLVDPSVTKLLKAISDIESVDSARNQMQIRDPRMRQRLLSNLEQTLLSKPSICDSESLTNRTAESVELKLARKQSPVSNEESNYACANSTGSGNLCKPSDSDTPMEFSSLLRMQIYCGKGAGGKYGFVSEKAEKNDAIDSSYCSPASPPPLDTSVYVATATPKIISGFDLRSDQENSYTTSKYTYKPLDVHKFSTSGGEASTKTFQLSRAAVEKLSEIKALSGLNFLSALSKDSTADDACADKDDSSTSCVNRNVKVEDEIPTIQSPDDIVSESFLENTAGCSREFGGSKWRSDDENVASRLIRDIDAQSVIVDETKNDNDSSRRSRWDIRPFLTSDNGDVDLRSPITCLDYDSRVSAEPICCNSKSLPNLVTVASDGPFISSNGDTDHRIYCAPTTMTSTFNTVSKPPAPSEPLIRRKSNLKTVHTFRIHSLNNKHTSQQSNLLLTNLSKPNIPNMPIFQRASTSNKSQLFADNSGFGPIQKRPVLLPNHTMDIASIPPPTNPSKPLGLPKEGVVVPDERLFRNATINPDLLLAILERFVVWKGEKVAFWRFKINEYILDIIRKRINCLDGSGNVERYVRYERIFGEARLCGRVEFTTSKPQQYKTLLDDAIDGRASLIIYVTYDPSKELSRKLSTKVDICTPEQLANKIGLPSRI